MTGAQKKRILIRFGGHELFFEDQLDRIGDRLKQALRSGAVRADTRLNARQRPAFIPRQIGEPAQQREDDDQQI